MTNEITVLEIGSRVVIGDDLYASITGVMIRAKEYIEYECVWWDGNTHNSKWLEEAEVTPVHRESGDMTIGFNVECVDSMRGRER